MTRNEMLKQKVLDAVADLALADGETNDYLHFLAEVEKAVADRINQLAAQAINIATGHAIPAAVDDDANERAAERAEGCCGAGCAGCDFQRPNVTFHRDGE